MNPPETKDVDAERRGWGWPKVLFLAGLVLGLVAGVVAAIVGYILLHPAISFTG